MSEPVDEDQRSEPLRFRDLVAATPLGDVVFAIAVCLLGATAVVALRRSVVAVLVVSLAVVIGIVLVASRQARRTGRLWNLRDYASFTLLVAGLFAAGAFTLLLSWVMLCDC